EGDITTLKIDAIVDGAIHRAAGPGLLKECRQLRGCSTGHAKITSGYKLSAKFGPQEENPEELSSCYRSVLDIIKEKNMKSVAFCCISTGIYGYDNEKAANVALKTVQEWLDHNEIVAEK
ncbi:O-acetyl-ADP-ribose deacetylase macrod1, partial [Podila epigama]